jgi:tRNA modification GTPase
MVRVDDTIVAPATPPFPSAIAIIRISGKDTLSILKSLTNAEFEVPRKIKFVRIYDQDGKEVIDEGMAVFFKGPKSYTGEDMAEIYLHGNPLLVDYVVNLCIRYGARFAGEGEFTKRAYLNGKITLEKAEAINSIIRSSTLEGVKSSLKVLRGEFEVLLKEIKNEILEVLSKIEASIDFPEDVDWELPYAKLYQEVLEVSKKVKEIAQRWKSTKVLIDGPKCVIVGKPNVGKSSIFNAILGQSRAIVSPIPGTTRDFIDAKIDIGGVIATIVDTAGIRRTPDPIEEEGIRRTKEVLKSADVAICVFDSSSDFQDDDKDALEYTLFSEASKLIFVINKIDIGDLRKWENLLREKISDFVSGASDPEDKKDISIIATSVNYKESIEKLRAEIRSFLNTFRSDDLSVISKRQKILLDEIAADAERALDFMKNSEYIGASYSLKDALGKIDEVFGVGSSEEVINKIFSNFCVGK